jgi:hypothetical protein
MELGSGNQAQGIIHQIVFRKLCFPWGLMIGLILIRWMRWFRYGVGGADMMPGCLDVPQN